MAKGYPDFFGTSIWPKYGAPIYNATPTYVLAPLEVKDVLSILGNGVFFGLHSAVYCDSPFLGVVICLFIDGDLMFDFSLPPTYIPAELGSGGPLLTLSVLDIPGMYSMFDLVREVPFRTSIKYTVTGNTLGATRVYANSIHYMVT